MTKSIAKEIGEKKMKEGNIRSNMKISKERPISPPPPPRASKKDWGEEIEGLKWQIQEHEKQIERLHSFIWILIKTIDKHL